MSNVPTASFTCNKTKPFTGINVSGLYAQNSVASVTTMSYGALKHMHASSYYKFSFPGTFALHKRYSPKLLFFWNRVLAVWSFENLSAFVEQLYGNSWGRENLGALPHTSLTGFVSRLRREKALKDRDTIIRKDESRQCERSVCRLNIFLYDATATTIAPVNPSK